jgi:hypothetical protein
MLITIRIVPATAGGMSRFMQMRFQGLIDDPGGSWYDSSA